MFNYCLSEGRPYPIVINSAPLGSEAYEYTVTWKAPATGGLPITHYEFQYRRVSIAIIGIVLVTKPVCEVLIFEISE
jgi:hypothetical protein